MRTMIPVVVVLGLTLLAASAATSASATTYVVKPDGTGDFATIQAAVDACVDGDIIELEDGTFTGDGNRDIDYLGKALTVRSRSGNPDLCVIDCQGTESERHSGFHFVNGEGPGSTLERVSIVNGYGHPWGGYSSVGGGILLDGASATIRECSVSDCYAYTGGGVAFMGSPAFDACTFSNNLSVLGGAVAVGTSSTAVFTDCLFESNTAATWAGGLSCYMAHATLVDCVFRNNQAPSGGAIRVRDGGEVVVTDCTFEDNTAPSTGGGIALADSSSAIVTGCTFYGNSSSAAGAI